MILPVECWTEVRELTCGNRRAEMKSYNSQGRKWPEHKLELLPRLWIATFLQYCKEKKQCDLALAGLNNVWAKYMNQKKKSKVSSTRLLSWIWQVQNERRKAWKERWEVWSWLFGTLGNLLKWKYQRDSIGGREKDTERQNMSHQERTLSYESRVTSARLGHSWRYDGSTA